MTAAANARDRIASREIRNTLVVARQAQGLTLAAVAERMDCHLQQLSKAEHPDGPVPGIDLLARWADALGYEIALLPKVPAVLPEAAEIGAAL